MDVYAERLDADYIKYTYPALHQFKYDADACTKVAFIFVTKQWVLKKRKNTLFAPNTISCK